MKVTDTLLGFYSDPESEYDIRHFVGKRSNNRANIKRVVDAINERAAEDGESLWTVAWSDRTRAATFMVLRRDKRKVPVNQPLRKV